LLLTLRRMLFLYWFLLGVSLSASIRPTSITYTDTIT
jgi:hypothetical protein